MSDDESKKSFFMALSGVFHSLILLYLFGFLETMGIFVCFLIRPFYFTARDCVYWGFAVGGGQGCVLWSSGECIRGSFWGSGFH